MKNCIEERFYSSFTFYIYLWAGRLFLNIFVDHIWCLKLFYSCYGLAQRTEVR